MKYFIFIIIALVAFFMLLPEPSQENKLSDQSKSNSGHFVITNTRVYDGNEIKEDVDIVIKDRKVLKIGKNLETDGIKSIDGSNKTLLPGLVDAHTHSYGNALTDALNFAVATELDMFSMPEYAKSFRKKRTDIENVTEADLFTSSILATAPGGHGTEYGFKIPVLSSTDEVSDFVKNRVDEGADYIKAVYNAKQAKRQHFPSISKEILKSLIDNAHDNNLMLVVHVDNLISAKHVISLGADGIVHSFMDNVPDQELMELMLKNKAFMIATLAVQQSVSRLSDSEKLINDKRINPFLNSQQKQLLTADFPDFGIPEQGLKNAMQGVKMMLGKGITVLSGTDAPNPGTAHGVSLHHELELMVDAGMSPEQAIHSATGAAGKYFDIGLRGTLKIGARASMFLVDGNPFENIGRIKSIDKIWKNGVVFSRINNMDIQNNNKVIKAGLITDFSQSVSAVHQGKGIGESSDKMAGGNSVVKLSLQNRSNSEDKYLHVVGELKKGFMYRWSGMSYLPGIDQQNGADLSGIKSLKFDAKTNQEMLKLSVLIFQAGSFQPVELFIELGESWKTHTIYLSDFKNVDLANVANISLVVSNKLGKFEFMLDNVIFE